MRNLRMISFGFQMINGVITVEDNEALIVKETFERYAEGEILKAIADDYTARGIVFYGDKAIWNKNMIARIIENRRYLGEQGYPAIIESDLFEKARSLKESKGKKTVTYTDEATEYLKDKVICAQCGKLLYRHPTWSVREKWICRNGCKNGVYVSDKEVIGGIQKILVSVKDNLRVLEHTQRGYTYNPTTEIMRQSNEIGRMTEQANVSFGTVKKLILDSAGARFSCCTEDKSEAHTENLKNIFLEWQMSDTLDVAFLKRVVNGYFLEKSGWITLTFINGARVTERGI